jgi:hypothetical protein
MYFKFTQILFTLFLIITLQGCIVGTVVSAPFKVVGAVVNTVTPDIVGDTISATGDVVDMAIPF